MVKSTHYAPGAHVQTRQGYSSPLSSSMPSLLVPSTSDEPVSYSGGESFVVAVASAFDGMVAKEGW